MHNPNYKNLRTWQYAMKLAEIVYEKMKLMPKEETNNLVFQIKKSVVSVPSNIAEGYGRNTTNDLVHFLYISRGSIFELDTQLELCRLLGYLETEDLKPVEEQLEITSKSLNKLISFQRSQK